MSTTVACDVCPTRHIASQNDVEKVWVETDYKKFNNKK